MSSLPPATRDTRRASDGGLLKTATARLVSWSGDQWDPVGAGRLLLIITGVITSSTAPLLHLNATDWRCLGVVAGSMSAVLLSSYLVPWSRLPGIATLLFPVAVWAALAALGLSADGLGANFTGLIAISFAYIGLTQSAATALRVTPVAVVAYLGAYNGWTSQLVSRLPIAITVWVLLAVLLAELIVHQRGLADKLRVAAHTDALTGLANRRDLEHRLISTRPGDALVICDLDHFKHLNDTLGHAAGDRVLADFGLALTTGLRERDYTGRYGGEEFALVLPATSGEEATAALRRLRGRWHTLQPEVTFSAGIAIHDEQRTPAETLRAADQALYDAKSTGRDCDVLHAWSSSR